MAKEPETGDTPHTSEKHTLVDTTGQVDSETHGDKLKEGYVGLVEDHPTGENVKRARMPGDKGDVKADKKPEKPAAKKADEKPTASELVQKALAHDKGDEKAVEPTNRQAIAQSPTTK